MLPPQYSHVTYPLRLDANVVLNTVQVFFLNSLTLIAAPP